MIEQVVWGLFEAVLFFAEDLKDPTGVRMGADKIPCDSLNVDARRDDALQLRWL